MSDQPGKAKRVMAVFSMMVGAGIVLDTDIDSIGAIVLTGGAVLMLWGGIEGLLGSRRQG